MQQQTISLLDCDVQQKVDFIQQPVLTGSVIGLRPEVPKHFLSQSCTKKKSWSLLVVAQSMLQKLSESDYEAFPHPPYSLVIQSCLTLGLQNSRFPCPSLSPGVCSNSCPLSQRCHPTISSSTLFRGQYLY